MADSITVDIKGIGLVSLKRSKRARNISISIKPFKGIHVAVPYRVSLKRAEEFVHKKAAWIKFHLEKITRFEKEHKTESGFADTIDRVKAKTLLTGRLRRLAEKYGFNYNKVTIRNQNTRWGSCSSKNNISLNIKLVKLPNELIDYVILHELAHTHIKDHSKSFWNELDKLVGNAKQMSSKLRSYGLALY